MVTHVITITREKDIKKWSGYREKKEIIKAGKKARKLEKKLPRQECEGFYFR